MSIVRGPRASTRMSLRKKPTVRCFLTFHHMTGKRLSAGNRVVDVSDGTFRERFDENCGSPNHRLLIDICRLRAHWQTVRVLYADMHEYSVERGFYRQWDWGHGAMQTIESFEDLVTTCSELLEQSVPRSLRAVHEQSIVSNNRQILDIVKSAHDSGGGAELNQNGAPEEYPEILQKDIQNECHCLENRRITQQSA